ncbi:Integrase [Caenorhabditis elegans]|uniref:Integrase n=1 Tax=Caenorhabditis elegans TaxID=6239 RepID=E9RKC6_CAEEL|nr:Integrase [Caenorhabditis elegans]CCD61281.1 Integrase [Caenorhabditis elegans]|eukprot:NP_001254047.1 Uncharacterized protein CELE_F59H6.14 [Caenorhabditis elegans]
MEPCRDTNEMISESQKTKLAEKYGEEEVRLVERYLHNSGKSMSLKSYKSTLETRKARCTTDAQKGGIELDPVIWRKIGENKLYWIRRI